MKMVEWIDGAQVLRDMTAGEIAELAAERTLSTDDYRRAVQAHIDAVAAERGYDSGQTCATYAADPHAQWAAEGAAFVAWRSAVWQSTLSRMAAVLAGDEPAPDIADLLADLPAMVWPTV